MNMKDKIKNNLITLIGISVGFVGGFLYWKFVGCATGTCPLSSNWMIMLAYGGLTGGLIGNVIQDKFNGRKVKDV
jgi:hypothetical protein